MTPDSALRMAENLRKSPGYYAGIVRNVIRDIEQVVNAGDDAFSTGDAPAGYSAFAAISGIFALMDSLVSSATWRFVTTMAKLGDQVLSSKTMVFSPYSTHPDIVPDYPELRTAKSRVGLIKALDGGDDAPAYRDERLVWRHGSPAGCYLLPASLYTSRRALSLVQTINIPGETYYLEDEDNEFTPAPKLISPGDSGQGKSRIDAVTAEMIERRLEGEYMPFYFRDLRTNEIISFHAFMTSLNENFAPTWTAVPGLGRIEDVQVYNKTSRTFDLSFILASTSESDHEAMWWSINKFVSMVYPQYSAGRQVQGKFDNKPLTFTMPFSQVPTAAPIVRMRLGDLAKSNMSRFGLSRLFGSGDPAMLATANGLPADRGSLAAGSELTDADKIANADYIRVKLSQEKLYEFKSGTFLVTLRRMILFT